MLNDLLRNKKIVFTILGFLPLSVSVIFTPIYTNFLPVKDYGFLNLYNTVIGLIAPFLHMGIKDGFGFLYWQNNDSLEKINRFFKKSLLSLMFVQLMAMFLFFLVGTFALGLFFESFKEEQYSVYVIVAAFYAFFLNINDFFFYYFRNDNQMKNFVLLNVFSLIFMTVGSILGIMVLDLGLKGAIYGKFIGYIFVILYFLIKNYRIFHEKVDFKFLKNISFVGFPILLSTIIGAYSSVCDKIYLQKYFSLEALAIYGMASTIMYLVDVLQISLMHYILPDLINKIKNNDSHIKIVESIREFFYVLSVFCFLIIGLSPLVKVVFSAEYNDVLLYIPMLCFVPFIKFLYNINSLNFYLYKSSRVFLKVQIISSVLTFLVLYFLSSRLNVFGAVLLLILYNVFQLVVSFIFIRKENHFVLKERRFYFQFITVLVLLLSLNILYVYFKEVVLYFMPLIVFLIFLYFTEKSFIEKIVIHVKKIIVKS